MAEQAHESARAAIKERAPGLARVVGAASPVMAELLRQRLPPGSLPLLLSMLHTLTGALGIALVFRV